ncbi:unnamed protein product [Amoebophrya sp. A25]|nr:unnamed protein product [Amoebophrya sp. A25]|eukprot:GSA25T00015265001.1
MTNTKIIMSQGSRVLPHCVAIVALAPHLGDAYMPIIGIVSQPVHIIDADDGVAGSMRHGTPTLSSGSEEGTVASTMSPRDGVIENARGSRTSYIAASYVKWLEAAGARPVPILYDWPKETLDVVLPQLSGILFAGGGADIDPIRSEYGRASLRIFEHAKQHRLPLWGTCLGFEQLLSYSGLKSGDTSDTLIPLIQVDAEKLLLPLSLASEAATTPVWTSLPKHAQETLMTKPVTVNMHVKGVAIPAPGARRTGESHEAEEQGAAKTGVDESSNAVEPLSSSDAVSVSVSTTSRTASDFLHDFWHVVATGQDRKNTSFVAMAEAKEFPFVAVQFHPEKNLFEYFEPYDKGNFELRGVHHTAEAFASMASLARYFVDNVVKSRFPSGVRMREEVYVSKLAFWLFSASASAVPRHGIMQEYFFDAKTLAFESNKESSSGGAKMEQNSEGNGDENKEIHE